MNHSSAFPTSTGKSHSCSTFLLRDENAFLIGHNLDDTGGIPLPGVICFNKRGVRKRNISFYEILTGEKPPSPTIHWTSRHGSVTFNSWGKEFIDGGINEAGLYVQEMSLGETVYPQDDARPRMFMEQWMLYLLDNYETVAQVLENLSQVIIDGWPWHYFLCDRTGHTAGIQFIDGQPNIYTGESMPVPALCNSLYPQEMENLANYAGFGGQTPVDLDDMETERFVHAAHMIQNAPASPSVDYAFDILKNLERGDDESGTWTLWSYVIDVVEQRVYWHTKAARERKSFDMHAFDLSCDTPAMMLDINIPKSGDMAATFEPYSPELNRNVVKAGIGAIDGAEAYAQEHGGTMENLINAIADFPESTECVGRT